MQRRRPAWHAAENHPCALSYRPQSGRPWNAGSALPRLPQGWRDGGGLFSWWCLGAPNSMRPGWSESSGASCANGPNACSPRASTGLLMPLAAAPRAFFPPEVAIHLVRLACERPDTLGRSLSQWDCRELEGQLVAEGIVTDISVSTVRRILRSHKLKPWRHHFWLYRKKPRDAVFYATVSDIIDL